LLLFTGYWFGTLFTGSPNTSFGKTASRRPLEARQAEIAVGLRRGPSRRGSRTERHYGSLAPLAALGQRLPRSRREPKRGNLLQASGEIVTRLATSGEVIELRLTLYSQITVIRYISPGGGLRAGDPFDDWTRQRSVRSLSTNAGAVELPFQSWRHFKEAFAPELVARAVTGHLPINRCIDSWPCAVAVDDRCRALPMLNVAVRLLRNRPAAAALFAGGAVEKDVTLLGLALTAR
jgi:hypothetical protein